MPNLRYAAPGVAAALTLAAGLTGCAGPSPLSGSVILGDLEHRGVPLPDRDTRTAATQDQTLPSEGPIRLADLLRVAESRSPAIAAAKSGIGIAAGERWQASLYPNPQINVLAEDVSLRHGVSDSKVTVGVTQPIIVGDRRQAAVNVAEAAQAARVAEVESRRRELFGEVAIEHVRLVSARAQLALYRDLREFANQTVEAAKIRVEAKAAPETDRIRPRVELYRIDAAIARISAESETSARRLSLILGGVEIDASRIDGGLSETPEDVDLAALEASIRTGHPELTVADREIESASAKLALTDAERTPDLDVRVSGIAAMRTMRSWSLAPE